MFKDIQFTNDLFVDRSDETKYICEEVYNLETSKIILLTAYSGIGKSAFVKQVVEKVSGKCLQTPIRVSTPPLNSCDVEKYFFLDQCFKHFAKKYNDHKKLSLQSYIAKGINKKQKRELHNKIIDDAKSCKSFWGIIILASSLFWKRIFKLDRFDYMNIFQESNSPNYSLKHDYIKFIFANDAIFLCIENIQNIDYLSFNCLLEWCEANKQKPNYFCLEYTLSDLNASEPAIQMANRLKESGVPVTLRELGILDSKYALEILRSLNHRQPDQLIFEEKALSYYENSLDRGNLIKLIDFAQKYTPSVKLTDGFDATLERLRRIEDKSFLYILSLVILSGGTLLTVIYEAITRDNPLIPSQQRIRILQQMANERYIKVELDTIFVFHACIIDTWYNNEKEFSKYIMLAYRALEMFLKECIQQSNTIYQSHDKNLMMLFKLYIKFEPSKIISLFDDLEKLLITSITTESAWGILGIIVQETKSKIADYFAIYERILNLCFTCELYEKGYFCIDQIEKYTGSINEKLYLYKCMFLSALDKHTESICILSEKREEFTENSRFVLNANIIMINNYRSLNLRKDCCSIAEKILSNKTSQQYPEYGYFLRLTDLYEKDARICLRQLKEGISFFMEKKLPIQASKTRINYAMQLALVNNLQEAKKQILLAEKYLSKHKYISPHMLLVNKAAIALLSGDFSDSVWLALHESEQSVVVPFDELAILNNKVIWCIEQKSYQITRVLESRILRLLTFEPDLHIHSITYYNLAVLNQQIKNGKKAGYYRKKAWKLRDHCTTLKKRFEKTKDTSNRAFLLEKPWHVCFLAYWTYDLLYE